MIMRIAFLILFMWCGNALAYEDCSRICERDPIFGVSSRCYECRKIVALELIAETIRRNGR